MAEITFTAAQIAPVDATKCVIRSYLAGETISKGQAVYILDAGTIGLADSDAAGKHQFRGIALNGGAAGQAVEVLQEGEIYGFTLAGVADSLAYLSDTAGKIDTAVCVNDIKVGRVVCLTDGSLTKVLRVFVQWEADWP